MSKSVGSILVLSLTTLAAAPASAMNFAAHPGAGVQAAPLALFAVTLIIVAAITRAYRRYMTPRLSGGLMSWALRQHGF